MDFETIKIKRALDRDVIKLKSISFVKTMPLKLEIGLNDYVKTLDFSWLTPDEFESFMARITEYCVKNKIEIE